MATRAWAAPSPSEEHRLEVGVRGGGSLYTPFRFVSVGADARLRLVSGLRLVGGWEAWATRQIPPADVQLESGVYSEWNWIHPVFLGSIYQLQTGPIEPHAGVELVVANHLEQRISVGGRARLGASWYFAGPIGLGLEVTGGAWSGQGWDQLANGARDTGPLFGATTQLMFGF